MAALGLSSVPALISHLDAHREDSTLGLAYANITDEGCVEVGKHVRDSPFVKYLDLRGNNIQAPGIKALTSGIKLNRSMKTLNLKWNCVGKDPSGVDALCAVLKSNLSIQNVDLRNNRINAVGAKSLAEMLKENVTITHLDLSWNDLGVEGGVALLEGLRHNAALVDCQLSGSKVGEEILHEVAFLVRRNRAAAAYRASAGGQAQEDPANAMAASGRPASRGLRAEGAAGADALPATRGRRPGAQWTAKDSSALMLRLMMREREQAAPEDKVFFQRITEHIDKLLLETSRHKQSRLDGEGREKVTTAGFLDREQRYVGEIRSAERGLQTNLAEKEVLAKDLDSKIHVLKQLQDERAKTLRENAALQERASAEEVDLRGQSRGLAEGNRALQDKLTLNQRDLDLLLQENERLRHHVKAFQRDVNEILGDGQPG